MANVRYITGSPFSVRYSPSMRKTKRCQVLVKSVDIDGIARDKDDYVHPSKEAHRIAAEAIFEYLMNNKYIRKELCLK